MNVLTRLHASPVPENVKTRLPLAEALLANTSRYDSLRGTDDVAVDTTKIDHAQYHD